MNLRLIRSACHTVQRGISLIEVMIGLAVAMIAMLVIVQIFSLNAASQRGTTGSSDATQTGTLAGYYINALVQQAGAGLARAQHVWGCRLVVTKGGTAIAPAASFPAPFDATPAVPTTIRVAPLIIVDGGTGSDVLISMAASSDSANRNLMSDMTLAGSVMTVSPSMPSFGFIGGDLMLAVPQETVTDPGDCQIVQVDPAHTISTTSSTALGNMVTFAAPADIGFSLSSTYGNVASSITALTPAVLHLGATPTFTLIGVDPTYSRLISYSLLSNAATTTPLAENIFMLKAAYGLDSDTTTPNVVDQWVLPSASGYTSTDLLAGTKAIEPSIDAIKAVRIAIVVRSSQQLSPGVTGPSSIKLFEALGSTNTITRSLTTAEQRYGYQVYEWVVPLRNAKYVNRK